MVKFTLSFTWQPKNGILTQMVKSLYSSLLLLLLLVGCSKQPKGVWVTQAPAHEDDLGLIVSGVSIETITHYINDGKISARLLHKDTGTFEIYGSSPEEIQKLIGVKSEKNQFWPQTPEQVSNENPANRLHLEATHANEIHRWNLGAGSRIAVIDTGFSLEHPDFEGKIQINLTEIEDNGIDDDNNGLIDDIHGWNFAAGNADLKDPAQHGTAVAGIIVSNEMGVAPLSQILPLKVMSDNQRIDEATVIAALRYAGDQRVDIVNISLGKAKVSSAFLSAIDALGDLNILVVTAAGNDAKSCKTNKVYPAAMMRDFIVSTAALSLTEPFSLATYSNYGDCIDFAIPAGDFGEGILSPAWRNIATYSLFNGTSAATPVLSGLAALIKSQFPELTATALKQKLIEATDPNDASFKGIAKYGLPRLDRILSVQQNQKPRWSRP